jgi:tetratricopeptide (TPR) repeat protein
VGIQWDDLKLRCEQAGAGGAVASSRYLGRQAVSQMWADPVRSLALLLKKASVLVTAHEVRNNIGAAFLAGEQGVFILGRWWPGFWLLGPLALVGFRRWGRQGQLLMIYVAALAFSLLPFFVNARFRAPMLPVLALFAAAAALDVPTRVRCLRTGQVRRGLLFLLGLLLAFLAVNVDWYDLDRPSSKARDHFYLATILAKGHAGAAPDPRAAERHFQQAIDLDRSDPDLPERYGQHLLALAQPLLQTSELMLSQRRHEAARAYADSVTGYLQRAMALHERAINLFPRSFRSHANLGSCHLWLGDGHAGGAGAALARGDSTTARREARQALESYAAAGRAYQKALAIWPAFPEAKGNLRLCLQRILDLPPLTVAIRDYQDDLRRRSGVDIGEK